MKEKFPSIDGRKISFMLPGVESLGDSLEYYTMFGEQNIEPKSQRPRLIHYTNPPKQLGINLC